MFLWKMTWILVSLFQIVKFRRTMCETHSWNTLTVIFTALEREIMQLFQGATTSTNSPQANAVCLHTCWITSPLSVNMCNWQMSSFLVIRLFLIFINQNYYFIYCDEVHSKRRSPHALPALSPRRRAPVISARKYYNFTLYFVYIKTFKVQR